MSNDLRNSFRTITNYIEAVLITCTTVCAAVRRNDVTVNL